MNHKITMLGLALAATVAIGGTAEARYITDGTLVHGYTGTTAVASGTYSNWMDRIGGSQFEVFGVEVNSSSAAGGTVNLSIYTNYGLTTEGTFGTRTADIAFKLTGESDFNHGIILFDHGTSARQDTNTLTAGFYEVDNWKTSQGVFSSSGFIYSGIAADCTDNASCNAADQYTVDTYIDQGTRLVANNASSGGISLAISMVNNVLTPDNLTTVADESGVAALHRIDISMTGVGSLFGPGWEMVFGNATCANDTIHITGVGIALPEPASVGLVLLGLTGLGAVRRRSQST